MTELYSLVNNKNAVLKVILLFHFLLFYVCSYVFHKFSDLYKLIIRKLSRKKNPFEILNTCTPSFDYFCIYISNISISIYILFVLTLA